MWPAGFDATVGHPYQSRTVTALDEWQISKTARLPAATTIPALHVVELLRRQRVVTRLPAAISGWISPNYRK
jgi:hypothetical protein